MEDAPSETKTVSSDREKVDPSSTSSFTAVVQPDTKNETVDPSVGGPSDEVMSLVRRLDEIGSARLHYAEETDRAVRESIAKYDAQIRANVVEVSKMKDRCDAFFEKLKRWSKPVYAKRHRLRSNMDYGRKKLAQMSQALTSQSSLAASVRKTVRSRKRELIRSLAQLYRNCDAIERSLGRKPSPRSHNECLDLSVYLYQKYLSDITRAVGQVQDEMDTRAEDVREFKIEELRTLLHQSGVENEILDTNIKRESDTLMSELGRDDEETPSTHVDRAHEASVSSLAALSTRRDQASATQEALESHVCSLRTQRDRIADAFGELKVAMSSMCANESNAVRLSVAEQHLRQIDTIKAQYAQLRGSFKDRTKTALDEARLEAQLKWQSRYDAMVRLGEQHEAGHRDTSQQSVRDVAGEIGRSFQSEFEAKVVKLRQEKTEHARLIRRRAKRLEELQTDLTRVERLKLRQSRRVQSATRDRQRLGELKRQLRDRWQRGEISSECVEKFLFRVQWTTTFTPEMITRCRERMKTLRSKLPIIRACRTELHRHLTAVRQLRTISKYLSRATGISVHVDEDTRNGLESLDLILPDPKSSPATQRIRFEALRDALIDLVDDLSTEIAESEAELKKAVKILRENGYVFKHRSMCCDASFFRDSDDLLRTKPDVSVWAASYETSLRTLAL